MTKFDARLYIEQNITFKKHRDIVNPEADKRLLRECGLMLDVILHV